MLVDPVYCTETGAYILKESQNRYGKSWASVGSYHSGYAPLDLPNSRRFYDCIKYIERVMTQYSKITGSTATTYADDMFSGVVVKVIDGDTILIKNHNNTFKVRLYSIDTPKQHYGQNAKNFTSDMILNKKIFGISNGKDHSGRIRARIYYDKIFLKRILSVKNSRYRTKGIFNNWRSSKIKNRII